MFEIYCIENTVNSKKYIGQTSQGYKKRWIGHLSAARKGLGYYICNAIRKYGEDSFTINVIEDKLETQEEANEAEKKWISFYNTTDENYGYNCTFGGEGGSPTEEVRQRQSETRKKLFEDPTFKARMSEANIGKHHTEEGCTNISKALQGNQYRKGILHSEEVKTGISESLKKAYAEGRHAKGKGLKKGTKLGPMSEEGKEKRSIKMKEYVRTPEHEAKRRAGLEQYYARKRQEKLLLDTTPTSVV